jgi:multiple sugar transport system permease protein
MIRRNLSGILLHLIALLIVAAFLYPFYWMVVSAFRSQEAVLSSPLRLWPETYDLGAWRSIAQLGGLSLWGYVGNSLWITSAATALGVLVTGLGAYALYRQPALPGFRLIRYGFMLTIMYPHMLLVIPTYFVIFKLGLLGTYTGIILVMSLTPLVFFVFVQFFRTIPIELVEAARIDGAGEWQILWRIIVPIAKPIILTAVLIAFLLNWKQWFPVLVLSSRPDSYTLPVALLSLNGEYGVSFQATMALATLTTLPVIVLFILTQRRVLGGFMTGAVKG